jgi:FixJ family two-component response regulator
MDFPLPGCHRAVGRIGALATPDVIAIIDDDALVRDSIRRLTSSLGFAAESFASADELFGSGVMQRAACVVADVEMPGGSAAELPDKLAARGCRAPVIFMTASPDPALEARLLDAGAVCVLSKPFSQREMLASIARALEHAGPSRAAVGPPPERRRGAS